MRSSDKINKPHIAVLSQKPNSLLLYGVHWNHATALGTFQANSFIKFFITLFVSNFVVNIPNDFYLFSVNIA